MVVGVLLMNLYGRSVIDFSVIGHARLENAKKRCRAR